MGKVIALLTDFGLRDPYVGMVKAVINMINPKAQIIDITHEVPKYDVEFAAFILKASYRYFRRGTIFLAVVDPGVGTPRRGIIVRSRNYVFIGPNNGLLTPAASGDGITAVYEIDIRRVGLDKVSHTFHGRDVFAPTAALLSLGVTPEGVGRLMNINELVHVDVPPKKPVVRNGFISTTVFHVDDFGNLMLETTLHDILTALGVSTGSNVSIIPRCSADVRRAYVVRTFGEVCEGCIALYENSLGLAEIAVFKGDASKVLNVSRGDVVCIGRA